VALALLIAWLAPRVAQGHPLSQGALKVTIYPDHVSVEARVSVEEMTVTNRLTSPDAAPGPFGAAELASYELHAAYLAQHLEILADGKRLSGGVSHVEPPANPEPKSTDTATYELLYALPPKAAPPLRIELRSDVLTETSIGGGMKWDASYVVQIGQTERESRLALLTSSRPVDFDCDWSPRAAVPGTAASSPNQGALFKDYFLHGIAHIFNLENPGYDHLLFVTALVLGATTLWELFTLVTAFTLAHTITLTLAALKLVHVPEHVVEPLIALSIVFVALENVIFPRRSHGWLRLGVAFFFGLFHGLGFAGALLEAMQGMNGSVVLVAIVAFSIGVEVAHQMVVIPLFVLLKIARQTQTSQTSKQRFSLAVQRYGSAVISLAGLFYLFVALRLSFHG
jgi:hypothetical protein